MKKSKTQELINAKPFGAIEALRRNLLYAIINGVTEDDMTEIAKAQVEKAKEGDTRAAKMLFDMVNQSPPSVSSREVHIREQGDIIDHKLELQKLAVALIAFTGPQTSEEIAARLHLTGSLTLDILLSPWFKKDGGKWHLTNDARVRVIDASSNAILSGQST